MRKIIIRIIVLALCVALIAATIVAGGFYGRLTDCKGRFAQSVEKWCEHYGVEKELVYAVIYAESGGDVSAVSRAGAIGVMQLMPDTARWLAEREKLEYSVAMLTDPDSNIRFGCTLLVYLQTRFDSLESVLAAYNAGPLNVDKWLADPRYSKDGVLTAIPYPETEGYVKKVCFLKKIYKII